MMNFVVTHFNVDDDDNFPTKTLVVANHEHEIEVINNPLGLVVAFTDSTDCTYEWYEDGKEWIDEDRFVCEAPEEWQENYWLIVNQAEQFSDMLVERTFTAP